MLGPNSVTLEQIEFRHFLDEAIIIQKPDSNKIWIGMSASSGHYSKEDSSFFKSNFFNSDFIGFNVKTIVETDIVNLSQWIREHRHVSQYFSKIELIETENSDDLYVEDVNTVINWIKNENEISKLVTISRAFFDYNKDNPESAFHPITYIDSYSKLKGSLYGHWSQGSGVIGVSPEPLFIKDKENWKTFALAGTISTKIDNYETLIMNDLKEREEHSLVIDDLSSKLKKIASDIHISDTYCFDFGPIAHIKTDLSFTAHPQTSAQDLVNLLSPSAALGGFPSNKVAKHLRKLKYYQFDKDLREFGGVFGFTYKDEAFALVAIRNLYWNQKQACIHSGSGIVKDSDPLRERSEIENKRASILNLFS